MKLFCFSALFLMVIGSAVAETPLRGESQSCRRRPDVVGKCFSVHGRLSVYNGTPSIRLWPIGTKRLLGVSDPEGSSNTSILPIDVKQKLDGDKAVFGNFVVCPLTRQQAGRMQSICIESGKNLLVREKSLTDR